MSYFQGQIKVYAYTICKYGQPMKVDIKIWWYYAMKTKKPNQTKPYQTKV